MSTSSSQSTLSSSSSSARATVVPAIFPSASPASSSTPATMFTSPQSSPLMSSGQAAPLPSPSVLSLASSSASNECGFGTLKYGSGTQPASDDESMGVPLPESTSPVSSDLLSMDLWSGAPFVAQPAAAAAPVAKKPAITKEAIHFDVLLADFFEAKTDEQRNAVIDPFVRDPRMPRIEGLLEYVQGLDSSATGRAKHEAFVDYCALRMPHTATRCGADVLGTLLKFKQTEDEGDKRAIVTEVRESVAVSEPTAIESLFIACPKLKPVACAFAALLDKMRFPRAATPTVITRVIKAVSETLAPLDTMPRMHAALAYYVMARLTSQELDDPTAEVLHNNDLLSFLNSHVLPHPAPNQHVINAGFAFGDVWESKEWSLARIFHLYATNAPLAKEFADSVRASDKTRFGGDKEWAAVDHLLRRGTIKCADRTEKGHKMACRQHQHLRDFLLVLFIAYGQKMDAVAAFVEEAKLQSCLLQEKLDEQRFSDATGALFHEGYPQTDARKTLGDCLFAANGPRAPAIGSAELDYAMTEKTKKKKGSHAKASRDTDASKKSSKAKASKTRRNDIEDADDEEKKEKGEKKESKKRTREKARETTDTVPVLPQLPAASSASSSSVPPIVPQPSVFLVSSLSGLLDRQPPAFASSSSSAFSSASLASLAPRSSSSSSSSSLASVFTALSLSSSSSSSSSCSAPVASGSLSPVMDDDGYWWDPADDEKARPSASPPPLEGKEVKVSSDDPLLARMLSAKEQDGGKGKKTEVITIPDSDDEDEKPKKKKKKTKPVAPVPVKPVAPKRADAPPAKENTDKYDKDYPANYAARWDMFRMRFDAMKRRRNAEWQRLNKTYETFEKKQAEKEKKN